jgi:gluconate 2-dehydrogenase gamma chain
MEPLRASVVSCAFWQATSMEIRRRDLLASTALLAGSGMFAKAETLAGALPWRPGAGAPPEAVTPEGWNYFSDAEGAAMEPLADRIIPPDADTPGGKDAGCAIFVDRQLAGPYGRNEGLYNRSPFLKGAKQQGPQDAAGPARQYRDGLAALDRHSRQAHAGKAFAELSDPEKDEILAGLESGAANLEGVDGKAFFEMVLKDVQQGFFADPIYGGNRDMVAWKMIGYPGARYDYRDWVLRHNERFPLPPVGIAGRADWTPRKAQGSG